MSLFDFERVVGFLTLATAAYTAAALVPQVKAYFGQISAGVLGLVISAGATLGSLALSEGFDLVPCELCWFQRIFMYPLPILIAIGLVARSSEVWRYVVGLAVVGAAISVYHLVVQWTPVSGTCSLDASCSTQLMSYLGFISIPAMALVAFGGTVVSMLNWRATS